MEALQLIHLAWMGTVAMVRTRDMLKYQPRIPPRLPRLMQWSNATLTMMMTSL